MTRYRLFPDRRFKVCLRPFSQAYVKDDAGLSGINKAFFRNCLRDCRLVPPGRFECEISSPQETRVRCRIESRVGSRSGAISQPVHDAGIPALERDIDAARRAFFAVPPRKLPFGSPRRYWGCGPVASATRPRFNDGNPVSTAPSTQCAPRLFGVKFEPPIEWAPRQQCLGNMADYYELISKAVAGLDPAAPSESRRALYERAQAALLVELRAITPPFTEAEITRERLALEEAVRRVEDEALRRARDVHVPSFRDHVSVFSDLASDAGVFGKSTAEAKCRHYGLQANAREIGRMARPSSLNVEVPTMIVTGSATGILGRIWRWRSRVVNR